MQFIKSFLESDNSSNKSDKAQQQPEDLFQQPDMHTNQDQYQAPSPQRKRKSNQAWQQTVYVQQQQQQEFQSVNAEILHKQQQLFEAVTRTIQETANLERVFDTFSQLHQHAAPGSNFVHGPHSCIKDKEIQHLKEELERAQRERDAAKKENIEMEKLLRKFQKEKEEAVESCRSKSKHDPGVMDRKFRGDVKTDPEKEVAYFFGEHGLYNTVWNEKDDCGEYELGKLLLPLTNCCYESAQDVILSLIMCKLKGLFKYQATATYPPAEFEDIHHGYGFLLSQCQGDHNEDVKKRLYTKLSKNEALQSLFKKAANEGNHKKMFNTFVDQLIHHSIKMVTVSPPMILYTQKTFDKRFAKLIPETKPVGPLQWIQPAIMKNLYGTVCVQGWAGNEDDFKKKEEKGAAI